MGDPWDRRIRRAEQLATDNGPAASLLAFYVRLLRSQKRLYESFHQHRPSGALARDLELIRAAAAILLGDVAEHGPPQLAVEARSLLRGDSSTDEALLNYWRAPSDRQFFAKAILQPYAQWLCDEGLTPLDRAWTRVYNRCPKCGGMPQLSILEAGGAGAGDGSGRLLLCATCLTPWPFRRVLCPHCNEEDERKLGYFKSPALPHQRVDACESCRHYLKSVDLGQLGRADPLIDEAAGASLDLWAREHGYEKIELNLLGV